MVSPNARDASLLDSARKVDGAAAPGSPPHAHATSPQALAAALDVDLARGLEPAEAQRRLASSGPNRLPDPPKSSAWVRLARQFTSPIVLTLMAAAVVALVLGVRSDAGGLARYSDAIAIALVVALNAGLGFFQERKADAAIESLRAMQAPMARVRRGGAVVKVPAAELVVGDVVELEAGDAVPADARLVEATAVRVDESALTGESVAVEKSAASAVEAAASVAERPTMLHTGTVVVAGTCSAIVTATAGATELGRIGSLVSSSKPEPTPLERHLGVFGRRILWACISVTLLLFAWGLARRDQTIASLLLEAVSFAVAIIPEGLPAVTTMTLAVGVQRMAKRGAVVRRLASVETLGSATVVCTDKTGTLTRNEMTVRELWVDGRRLEVTGSGYGVEGRVGQAAEPREARDALERLLVTAAVCNEAHVDRSAGRAQIVGDPTEAALVVLVEKAGLDPRALRAAHLVIDKAPFDSKVRRMTVVASSRGERGASRTAHVKGAVDELLPLCAAVATARGDRPLGEPERERVVAEAEHMAKRGLRVLAFAERPDTEAAGALGASRDLVFLGLVGMEDPPRDGVAEAVRACAEAGVRTVMITGDHAATATAIARSIDIASGEEQTMTGAELEALDDATLAARIESLRVFARVAPEQKLRIVRALAARGHIVAMTGDGVNDAPALRAAHIGIAMGRGGTEVARQAADVVLTDDDFTTLVAAIREGRAIYRNIQKFVFFLLSSNAGLALATFTIPLLGPAAALTPTMLLWINLVTNGLPALALGVDPPTPEQMREPPRRPNEPLLGRRDVLGMAFVGAVVASSALVALYAQLGPREASPTQLRTAAFFVLALGPLLHAWSCRSPTSSIVSIRPAVSLPLVGATIAAALLQSLVLLPALRPVFQTEGLAGFQIGLIAACSVVVLVVVEVAKAVGRWRVHRGRRGPTSRRFTSGAHPGEALRAP